MAENRYSVDYAKLGTSACKKCKAKIAKGEIRIAKLTPSPFSEGDMMKIYHHVPCIFDTFLHARATTKIIESSTDLDGWSDITPLDREIILEKIKQVQTARANKPPSKSPVKKATKSAEPTALKQTPITPTKKTAPETTITPTKKIASETTVPVSTENDDESTVDYDDDIQIIDKKKDEEEEEEIKDITTDGIHAPLNDDPKHPDNSFRQFRALCTKIAETNGHLAKTAIVQDFITYGIDGESYKGESINENFIKIIQSNL
jgi:DNA ligase-3